jgi:hypothetical protein
MFIGGEYYDLAIMLHRFMTLASIALLLFIDSVVNHQIKQQKLAQIML